LLNPQYCKLTLAAFSIGLQPAWFAVVATFKGYVTRLVVKIIAAALAETYFGLIEPATGAWRQSVTTKVH
jgi:hypothetical protein